MITVAELHYKFNRSIGIKETSIYAISNICIMCEIEVNPGCLFNFMLIKQSSATFFVNRVTVYDI